MAVRVFQGDTLDSTTYAVKTIDYAHKEIHSGSSYTCHYSTDVSDTDFRTAITFKTANTTKWGHMVVGVTATDTAIAYVYEAVLIAGGTAGQPVALTIYNRNRNSSNTSGFISQHSTPVTGGASGWTEALLVDGAAGNDDDWAVTTELELENHPLGGGKKETIGGTSRGSQELILKQNTVYMVMIQSSNANDNTHTIHLDWYEHTDKE